MKININCYIASVYELYKVAESFFLRFLSD